MIPLVIVFLATSVTVFCIFKLVLYYSQQKSFYKKSKNFYGPKTLPLIGNAHLFSIDTADIFQTVEKILCEYPSPCRIWLGNRIFIAFTDPDQLKTVLTSPKALEKADLIYFMSPWLGRGLFTAPVSTWKIHRKLISPTFNTTILESFVDTFARQSLVMIREMETKIDESIDMFHVISACALDMICETSMGVSMNVQTKRNNRYAQSASRALEILSARIFNVWQHSDFIFNFTATGKELKEHFKYFHDFVEQIIQKKEEKYQKDISTDLLNENAVRKKKPFLDHLLNLKENGAELSEKDIRDEINTMLITASDTSASTGSFVTLMLANYPDIQEKVYQELYEIYGPSDPENTPVKYEDLNRMEYLERVIKETIRLFPVAHILARQMSEDLELGKWVIPKGAGIIIPVFHLHRDEKYWPNPLKFDPDRFLPENVAKRNPNCFIPFSTGPRNCIGMRYAMMTQKTMLSTILRRFKVKIDSCLRIEDVKFRTDITLKVKEPIKIRIERRNNA